MLINLCLACLLVRLQSTAVTRRGSMITLSSTRRVKARRLKPRRLESRSLCIGTTR
jgi:hypothetical protein